MVFSVSFYHIHKATPLGTRRKQLILPKINCKKFTHRSFEVYDVQFIFSKIYHFMVRFVKTNIFNSAIWHWLILNLQIELKRSITLIWFVFTRSCWFQSILYFDHWNCDATKFLNFFNRFEKHFQCEYKII